MGLLAQNLMVMDMGRPFRLAQRQGWRGIEQTAEAEMFWGRVRDGRFEFVSLDPFVEYTGGSEADNGDQHEVMRLIRGQAQLLRCAVGIVHHTGKLNGRATLDSIRGASSIAGAVRSACAITELGQGGDPVPAPHRRRGARVLHG